MKIKEQLSETKIINVMDREGDFFELFDEHRTNCQDVELLVRASHNRKTKDNEKLFDAVKNTPVQGKAKIEISRQSQQKKKGKQKARNKREAREAEVSIRFTKVEIKAPYPYENKDPLEIYVVNVCEENPSKEVEGIDWYLLTTMTIKTIEDAEECVKYYRLRWRIEDLHRVVKSGCKVEELGNQTAERLKRVIAINLVIAWKIMLMTLLGREAPELPGEILFSEIEIEVLKAFAEKENIKKIQKHSVI
ncbi:MAG: transposase [Candidatus Magnetoglobus multicellularis str. Araruama]|uniref:Transposase n=1 Tax=Candidatus Magnetoglobus multicellularis str. Araruama TaxID=890399 RepID=A0A1V1P0A3_9BACT|nr:MAG: transposase [Candidatus Magnetoglobus multicellularis str. Araruama]